MEEQKLRETLSNLHLLELAKKNAKRARFSGQHRYEIIFLLFRQASIRNISWLIKACFLAVLPIFLTQVFSTFSLEGLFNFEINVIQSASIYILYYSVLMSWIMYRYTDWYLDVFVVTNERFLEFLYTPLGNTQIREVRLEDIEAVKATSAGILGSIFNYGNIKIILRNDTSGTVLPYVYDFRRKQEILTSLTRVARKYLDVN